MECAGIAEAGGVKNVSFSLCKELMLLGHEITLFIPIYKSTSFSLIKDVKDYGQGQVQINHCGKQKAFPTAQQSAPRETLILSL